MIGAGALTQDTPRMFASSASKAVPEAFYIPMPWSAVEQDAWLQTTPFEQLRRLTSRCGWVADQTAVVPFAIELQERMWARPILNGLKAASLTVYISPYPHVGRTMDMRKLCEERTFEIVKSHAFKGREFHGRVDGWSDFRRFRVANCRAIIDKLDDFFRGREGEDEMHVTLYGSLKKAYILAAKEAADAGEPYGPTT